MDEGFRVVIFMFLLSFAIDRVATVVSLIAKKIWVKGPGSSDTVKLIYFLTAGTIAAVILMSFREIRAFAALNQPVWWMFDVAVTWILLIGGSAFVGRLLQLSGAYDEGSVGSRQPIQVRGVLEILEDGVDEDTLKLKKNLGKGKNID
jgi:hypothetical protein